MCSSQECTFSGVQRDCYQLFYQLPHTTTLSSTLVNQLFSNSWLLTTTTAAAAEDDDDDDDATTVMFFWCYARWTCNITGVMYAMFTYTVAELYHTDKLVVMLNSHPTHKRLTLLYYILYIIYTCFYIYISTFTYLLLSCMHPSTPMHLLIMSACSLGQGAVVKVLTKPKMLLFLGHGVLLN